MFGQGDKAVADGQQQNPDQRGITTACGPAVYGRWPTAIPAAARQQRESEFGPVDLAIMENGQYDQDWKYIHMMPDETAQAADDPRRSRGAAPGHAGRFVLAKHSWDELYQRLAAASEGRAWRC